MKPLTIGHFSLSCALFALFAALPAGAVPLDAGLLAARGAWAAQG